MGNQRSSFARAAHQIGVSREVYAANRAAGLLWCSRCKEWHPAERFGFDAKRGRRRVCTQSKRPVGGEG